MSEILDAARLLRDRLAVDASHAKDRAEYLRTVANWNDMNRIVDGLVSLLADREASDADRLEAAEIVLDMNRTLSEG